jgi:hypothetical protein
VIWLALSGCFTGTPAPPPDASGLVGLEVVVERDAPLEEAAEFFASRPRHERSQVNTDQQAGQISASACGGCHSQIAKEWEVSVHAAAWRDPQFQAETHKSGNRWLCMGCHTPLISQLQRLPVGLVNGDVERPLLADNPTFDARLRDEGITCAACHLADDGAIEGPGLGGDAPHRVRAAPRFQDESVCTRCHQAEVVYPGKSFACAFATGEEWEASPWPAQDTSCVDCHMPEVERPAADGGPLRMVRRHWWRGSGLPKEAGVHPPADALQPGLELTAERVGADLEVVLRNGRAGHMLPTGDPERWIQVEVFFEPSGGQRPAWSTRIGQVWEWEKPPKKLEDTRILPGAEIRRSIPIPLGARRAQVVARHHRISEANAGYHGLDPSYPRSMETHRMVVELAQPGARE